MATDPFYRSKPWLTLRAAFLRDNSRCATPGCLRSATHVDHIKPRRAHPALALDWGNLQGLCHSCHSTKTASRDGGWGHAIKRGEQPVRGVKGCDTRGYPLDPTHPWAVQLAAEKRD